MMNYEAYQFVGMHLFWWIMWLVFLVWIFATPYTIPGQRSKKESPLDILKKRFALGELSNDEYQEKKLLITS